jgi:hypothetical protein
MSFQTNNYGLQLYEWMNGNGYEPEPGHKKKCQVTIFNPWRPFISKSRPVTGYQTSNILIN